MRNKCVVIGDITLDFIANTPKFPIESQKSVLSEVLLLEPGGNANVMIMAARLGAEVVSIGYLGRDMQGSYVNDILCEEKIDTSRIVREGTTTTVVTLTDLKGKHVFHGKHGTGPAIENDVFDGFDWKKCFTLFINGYTVSDARTKEVSRYAAVEAKKHACKVILDPGPDFKFVDAQDKKYYLALTDYLLLTEEEIILTGYESITALRAAYPDLDIIEKRGKEGAIVHEKNGSEMVISAHEDVVVVDTSGAGDSFAGGFMAAIHKGKSVTEAALIANCVGESKVQKVGCGRQVPTKAEVLQFIKHYGINVLLE